MASYISTPNFLPRSIAAPTGLQALPFPWFLQGLCPNTFPYQSLVYSPPAIPAVTAPVLQHGVFHWASPVSPNQTNKSFMIRDILGTTDLASSHTTALATGEKCEQSKQLQNMPSSMFSFFVLPTQKERAGLGYCRTRTTFSKHQISQLEESFKKKKYINGCERFLLAKDLGLSPVVVKTWYQNKRMKWKKELQDIDPSCRPTKPKGRPPKHISNNTMKDY